MTTIERNRAIVNHARAIFTHAIGKSDSLGIAQDRTRLMADLAIQCAQIFQSEVEAVFKNAEAT